MEHNIVWQPQDKQKIALSRVEDEILFGGARGGGKTDAGIVFPLYNVKEPKFRALVVRKNAVDLSDWIDRAKQMYKNVGGVYVNGYFEFPSGAKIRTGHLDGADAYQKYQGHEYQNILIEELTHIGREDDYEKLITSCRSTVDGIKAQIFATTNPDGPGRKWVKKRWNIPNNPDDTVIATEKGNKKLVFVPSRVQDNKILMEKDPNYINQLESISDEELKKAWLEGSWEGFNTKGAYYSKELEQARIENRITTVPYDKFAPVMTAWDLGYNDSTAITIFQKIRNEIRVIDYYENSGESLDHYVQVLRDKGYNYSIHYLPHDARAKSMQTGFSVEEVLRKQGLRVEVIPMESILAGINAVRMTFNRIWIDKDKCDKLIDALSQYQKEWDEKRGEFKDRPLHDWTSHGADSFRYMCMIRDIKPLQVTYGNAYKV